MSRLALISILALLFFPHASIGAEEYLLHIERVGYENAPVKDPVPREELFSSLQFPIRIGVPFSGRTATKYDRIVVKGELKSAEVEKFMLHLNLDASQVANDASVTIMGVTIPGRSSQRLETQLNLKLGQRLVCSGGATRTKKEGQDEVETKFQFRVRITKFDPANETPEAQADSDQAYLNAKWNAFELIQDGVRTPDASARQVSIRIQHNLMILEGPEPTFGKRAYDMKLDTGTSPKRFLVTAVDGKFKGHSAVTLYDISTRDLQILLPDFENPEPVNLESETGSKRILIRLSKFEQSN